MQDTSLEQQYSLLRDPETAAYQLFPLAAVQTSVAQKQLGRCTVKCFQGEAFVAAPRCQQTPISSMKAVREMTGCSESSACDV